MLSSAEALAQFMYNPSPYLLEPNPRVPCKLCVLGTLASGKTSLTKSLAEHFNAVVSITIKTGFTALKPEVNTAINGDVLQISVQQYVTSGRNAMQEKRCGPCSLYNQERERLLACMSAKLLIMRFFLRFSVIRVFRDFFSVFISHQVIEMDKLIEPVLEKVLEEAVEEARTKAMEETISRLKAVQAAVQAHQGMDASNGAWESFNGILLR